MGHVGVIGHPMHIGHKFTGAIHFIRNTSDIGNNNYTEYKDNLHNNTDEIVLPIINSVLNQGLLQIIPPRYRKHI